VELRTLLTILLRFHEREKAKRLHTTFETFLEKIRSHLDLVFVAQAQSSEQKKVLSPKGKEI
jgi:hypothetical protein